MVASLMADVGTTENIGAILLEKTNLGRNTV